MPLLLALTLLLQPPPSPGAEPVVGVVAEVAAGCVYLAPCDGTAERVFPLEGQAVVWHLDSSVELPPWAVRAGVKLRVSWPYNVRKVEVISLGPYQRRAEDEERYIAAIQALPDAVPTEDQVRRGVRLRLDKAPRGCDLALGPEEVAIIEAMGSTSCMVRECVTKALRERGIAAMRTLIWARHAPDEEIRTRAEMLLRELGWPVP